MKNLKEILKAQGIEVEDDKYGALEKAVLENYKTVADYENQVNKANGYKTSLEELQTQVETLKNAKSEDYEAKIKELQDTIDTERDERKKADAKRLLESKVDAFLNKTEDGKLVRVFVNDITKDAIRSKMIAEVEKDENKGVDPSEILKKLTTDANGKEMPNIFAPKKKGYSFTDKKGDDGEKSYKGLSLDERIKMKNEDPELYKTLKSQGRI